MELLLVERDLVSLVDQFKLDFGHAQPFLNRLDVLEIQDVRYLIYFALDYVKLLKELEKVVSF
jgi:hypothetical protein